MASEHTPPSTAPADRRSTSQEWSEILSAKIVAEVKRRREALGLRAQDVADMAAELGVHMPRGVIARLESGERKQLTVAELMAFSAILRTTPVHLMAPITNEEAGQVAPLPGLSLSTTATYCWLVNGGPMPGTDVLQDRRLPPWSDLENQDRHAADLITRHQKLVSTLLRGEIAVAALRSRRRHEEEAGDEKALTTQEMLDEHMGDLDRDWVRLSDLRDEIRYQHFNLPELPNPLCQRSGGRDDLGGWGLNGWELGTVFGGNRAEIVE